MELIIITAVQSFEQEVRSLLKANGVKAYSHTGVLGHRESAEAQDENWFASEPGEQTSILFYVFLDDHEVDGVLHAVKELNQQQETRSHVHALVLEVKKSV